MKRKLPSLAAEVRGLRKALKYLIEPDEHSGYGDWECPHGVTLYEKCEKSCESNVVRAVLEQKP